MLFGDTHEPAPVCPEQDHELFRVVRDGYQGNGATRRQRWRCVNPNQRSQWHRITPKLNRAVGAEYWCADCSQHVSSSTGQPIANSYEFVATQIATALHDVGKGMSYRQATLAARREYAERVGQPRRKVPHSHPLPPPRPRQKLRRGVQMGQLVAGWVGVFTDSVAPELTAWPMVVLLDSSKFFRLSNQPAFEVMFAYGYDAGPGGTQGAGRLLKAVAVKTASYATWTSFINSTPGSPLTVVSDGDTNLVKAAQANWRTSKHLRCTWHWADNLADAVRKDLEAARYTLIGIQKHPLFTDTSNAFQSEEGWDLYKLGLQSEFATPGSGQASTRWIKANEPIVLEQIRSRGTRPPIESTAPLESHIHDFRKVLAERSNILCNKARTNLLLRLMVAARQPNASTRAWTELLLVDLHTNKSRTKSDQRALVGSVF